MIAADEKWFEKEYAHLVSFDTYGGDLDCDPSALRQRLDDMEADALEMDRAYQEAITKVRSTCILCCQGISGSGN